MFRLLRAALAGCLVALPPVVSAAEDHVAALFVAPDGSDEHPGTIEQPLRTLAAAQKRLREKIASGASGRLRVLLWGGVYRLPEPLRFGPEDAAPEGSTLTYAAYPGEEAVLSGGEVVTGWRQVGEVLETTLPAPLRGTRELFINGRRATRARTPNAGYFRVEAPGPDRRTAFTFQNQDLQDWPDARQGEVVYLHDWSVSRIGIEGIDPQQRTVLLRNPIGDARPYFSIGHFEPHPRYYIENIPALLDEPGEWVLDARSGRLRYWPREGESAASIEAVVPRRELLLHIRGERAENRLVRGLRFERLVFRHCRWTAPVDGYAGAQATFHDNRSTADRMDRVPVPSAIRFELAERCALEDCTIEMLGGSAVELGETCRANEILRCRIRDIAGNGVNLGEPFTRGPLHGQEKSLDEILVATGNRVADCTIERCGVVYHGAVGIWIGIAAGTEIVHNELRELPYSGISVGWRWSDGPSGCRENLIAHNHIHDIMQRLSDGGGIYTLGRQPGTVLRGNRIHAMPVNAGRAESNGIFMDEGSTEILVEGNTIYAIARSPIRFHRAGVNVVRNNVLVSAPGVPSLRYNATPEHMVLANNATIVASDWQPSKDDPTAESGPRR